MNLIQKIFTSIKEGLNNIKTFLLYSLIAIVLITLTCVGAYFASYQSLEVTIEEKERINTGTGQNMKSKYIVFTTDEVFENTDNFVFGKFDSSDVQNKLKIGNTYQVKVVGWRIPLFSWYRNIILVKE